MNDKVKLVPKTGGGYTVVSAGNYANTPPSRDDLPIFDPKGNILNEYGKNNFGYSKELDHKRQLKKSLQKVHTKQRFQYKGSKVVSNSIDSIGNHLKNSNTYRIKMLEQSSNRLWQFINELIRRGLTEIDIDPNGASTIVYIKQPSSTKDVTKWDSFLNNCEALYGNSLEYLDKDNEDNLVYKLKLGVKEIEDGDV